MKRTYQAKFQVGTGGTLPTNASVLSEIISCVVDGDAKELLQAAHSAPAGELELPDERTQLRVAKAELDGFRCEGVRIEGRGPEGASRTDAITAYDIERRRLVLAVSSLASEDRGEQVRQADMIACARAAHGVIQKYGGHADRELSADPVPVDSGKVKDLVEFLLCPDRTLPVVLVSPIKMTSKPIIDDGELAQLLAGRAHVYTLLSRFPGYKLSDSLAKHLSCFDGAVRVYWPGLTRSANPRDHRFWLPRHLVGDGKGPRELLDRIALHWNTAVLPDHLRWEGLERSAFKSMLRDRESSETDGELVAMLEREMDRQDQQIAMLTRELDEARIEIERHQREADAWRQAYEEVATNGPGEEGEEGGEGVSTPESLDSLQAAVEAAGRDAAPHIAIRLNSSSSVKTNPYEDPTGVYRALTYLAGSFLDVRMGRREGGADFVQKIKEETGFEYIPKQSPSSVGLHPEEYQTTFLGRTYELGEHLRKGASRDPRHTIRIAFAVDEDLDVVIVGYIGQHQSSRRT